MNDWIVFYLVGCGLSLVLNATNGVVGWFISWVTRTNVLVRNMKKLAPPDQTSWFAKARNFLGILILDSALSWISVVVSTWQLVRAIFGGIRDLLSSTPEAVRLLRFPLKNNRDLPAESVWAYLCGLGVLAGHPMIEASDLLLELQTVVENCPRFDRRLALRQLHSLHVVDPSIVFAALAEVDRSEE